jgi:hypothetical protein
MAGKQAKDAVSRMGQDAVRRFARRLKASLNSDRTSEAVRLFTDGVAHELVPDRPDLGRWLMRVVGRTETLRLVKAFALKECFYCKGGLERCDACDGRGYYRDGPICDRCIGLGVAACDFCTGSGWVTYNCVPAGLRLYVILARVKAATGKADTLMGKNDPAVSGRSSREKGKALAKELLLLNRLLGVFENAIVVGEKLSAQDATAGPGVRKLVKTCRRGARRLEPRVRQVVQALAEVARLDATRAIKPVARAVAARRAEFYQGLATSNDFFGSGLHHPHLHEPPDPREARSAAPAPGEPRPEEPG